jgi:hypothetical protein
VIKQIAVTAALAAGVAGLALGGASASAAGAQYANGAAHGAGAAASYASGTWTLDSGHGPGGSAQVDLVKPGTSAVAPTFTASTENAGNPRWVITFHNGDYLFGYPPAGSGKSVTTWALEPAGMTEPSYAAALAAAQAGGLDDQVTGAFIVNDTGNPDATVHLTDVTYNGEDVVPSVARSFLYGGHVIMVSNNRAELGWKFGGAAAYACARTFGYGMTVNGSPHLGFTSITTGYWRGLAAGHTYDIEFYPCSADRVRTGPVGWIKRRDHQVGGICAEPGRLSGRRPGSALFETGRQRATCLSRRRWPARLTPGIPSLVVSPNGNPAENSTGPMATRRGRARPG